MKKESRRRRSAALVCGSMLAVALVGGTMAYLTDTDSDVNVMTLGNVDIEQIEQERDANGALKDFTQGKPAYPAVGPTEWAGEGVEVNGTEYRVFTDDLKNVVDKIVTVKNTGKSDAYIRTIVAIEAPDYDPNDLIHINWNGTDTTISDPVKVKIDDADYVCFAFTYKEALEAGKVSAPSLVQVFLDSKATNDDVAKFGDEWEIKVLSQAVQTNGFADAATALEAAFPGANDKDVVAGWFSGDEFKAPTAVATAEELSEALAAGESVYLTEDITNVDANTAITVAAGKEATLNLNGHKITAAANKTGNQELFLVKGTLNVENGVIELTAQNNQEWNAMAAIFDVTAGGVLNMEGVTASASGTDMNFIVHLNNWGEATANINNCDFTATYVAVRAFNSGYDMNNVTIKNTDFHTGRMFWVHNYTAEGKDDSTLNLDIYGNGNTAEHEKPVRFGFSDPVYYNIDGNEIA